jgi:hypothetical protein
MPLTFDQAEKKFKDSDINGLAKDTDGLRYLKIRSAPNPATPFSTVAPETPR